jgi:stage II sporulation protein M
MKKITFLDFLRYNYSKSFAFFKESKTFILFSCTLFLLFFIIGFVFPIFFREEIFKFIFDMKDIFTGRSIPWMISFIFFNNLKASAFAIIFGIILGILPLLTVVVNGYLVGFVSREVVSVEGISAMWRLVPHGIFELPAIIFSIGLGLKIGMSIFSKKRAIKYNFKESIRFFVFVVFPLLLIAAIIEGVLLGLSA